MKVFLIIIVSNFWRSCESSKAAEMCKKYSEAVYTYEESPVLSRRSKINRVSNCGIVSIPLIIGGSEASPYEFPHMAVIGFGESPKKKLAWLCGGSLISDLFVLTAAHCLEHRSLGPAQVVKLGATNLYKNEPNVLEKRIVEKIPYPDYRPPSKAHDLALFKLESPVVFTSNVRPTCLNTGIVKTNSSGIASGFGKKAFQARDGSKNLMKVTLNVYANEQCKKALHMNITDNMICAGQLAGGRDTCQGDSGGPLQTVLHEPYCMYNLIGVTSFGKFCGYAYSPAIYTNVSSYIPWIEKIVWP